MNKPLLVLLLAQLIFTASDFMGRYYMSRMGFSLATFLTPWFVGYTVLRSVATIALLYVFAFVPLGKTVAMLAAMAIVLSNLLGILFLKEALSPGGYFGVALAITALLILASR